MTNEKDNITKTQAIKLIKNYCLDNGIPFNESKLIYIKDKKQQIDQLKQLLYNDLYNLQDDKKIIQNSCSKINEAISLSELGCWFINTDDSNGFADGVKINEKGEVVWLEAKQKNASDITTAIDLQSFGKTYKINEYGKNSLKLSLDIYSQNKKLFSIDFEGSKAFQEEIIEKVDNLNKSKAVNKRGNYDDKIQLPINYLWKNSEKYNTTFRTGALSFGGIKTFLDKNATDNSLTELANYWSKKGYETELTANDNQILNDFETIKQIPKKQTEFKEIKKDSDKQNQVFSILNQVDKLYREIGFEGTPTFYKSIDLEKQCIITLGGDYLNYGNHGADGKFKDGTNIEVKSNNLTSKAKGASFYFGKIKDSKGNEKNMNALQVLDESYREEYNKTWENSVVGIQQVQQGVPIYMLAIKGEWMGNYIIDKLQEQLDKNGEESLKKVFQKHISINDILNDTAFLTSEVEIRLCNQKMLKTYIANVITNDKLDYQTRSRWIIQTVYSTCAGLINQAKQLDKLENKDNFYQKNILASLCNELLPKTETMSEETHKQYKKNIKQIEMVKYVLDNELIANFVNHYDNYNLVEDKHWNEYFKNDSSIECVKDSTLNMLPEELQNKVVDFVNSQVEPTHYGLYNDIENIGYDFDFKNNFVSVDYSKPFENDKLIFKKRNYQEQLEYNEMLKDKELELELDGSYLYQQNW